MRGWPRVRCSGVLREIKGAEGARLLLRRVGALPCVQLRRKHYWLPCERNYGLYSSKASLVQDACVVGIQRHAGDNRQSLPEAIRLLEVDFRRSLQLGCLRFLYARHRRLGIRDDLRQHEQISRTAALHFYVLGLGKPILGAQEY